MGSKKSPRPKSASGEISVRRSLRQFGRTLSSDAGTEEIELEPIEGPVAEANGSLALTDPQDEEYKVLRVSVGGTLPCSVEDFKSRRAHRYLFRRLREEMRYQMKRGTEGLE